jgi:hypothetical protein
VWTTTHSFFSIEIILQSFLPGMASVILLNTASQVARITGVSHCHGAWLVFFFKLKC